MNRQNVFVTNVCKIRPTHADFNGNGQIVLKNRTPTDEELESWKPFLIKEIDEQAPYVILALGGCAAKTILNTQEGITKLRGKVHRIDIGKMHNIAIVPTFHPSYVLRSHGDKIINKQVKEDLKLAQKLLNG